MQVVKINDASQKSIVSVRSNSLKASREFMISSGSGDVKVIEPAFIKNSSTLQSINSKIETVEPSTATTTKKDGKVRDSKGSNSAKDSPRITAPRRRSSDIKNSIEQNAKKNSK